MFRGMHCKVILESKIKCQNDCKIQWRKLPFRKRVLIMSNRCQLDRSGITFKLKVLTVKFLN